MLFRDFLETLGFFGDRLGKPRRNRFLLIRACVLCGLLVVAVGWGDSFALGGEKGHFLVHKNAIKSIRFSPQSRFLTSSDSEGNIVVWDMVKKQPWGTFLMAKDRPAPPLAFTHDDKTLATANPDDTICLWNLTVPKSQPTRVIASVLRNHAASRLRKKNQN